MAYGRKNLTAWYPRNITYSRPRGPVRRSRIRSQQEVPLPTIAWELKGVEFANCNCSYGCPCQFNALPTHGFCAAAAGFQIDTGYFADVKLDDLRAAGVCKLPGG